MSKRDDLVQQVNDAMHESIGDRADHEIFKREIETVVDDYLKDED